MNSYLVLSFLLIGLVTTGCGGSGICQQGGCDDDNACTTDMCNLDSGSCENTPTQTFMLCEVGGGPGVCSSGTCASMSCEGIACDDGNPCTVDACFDELGACVGVVVPAMTACEVEGALGVCDGAECDLGAPPTGDAELRVSLPGLEASVVAYELSCAEGLTLSGNLANVGDDWEASFTLPAGDCTLQVFARDQDGEVVCTATATFEILPDTVTPVPLVLICNVSPSGIGR